MTDSLQHTHKTLVIIRISNKLLLVSLVTEYERLSTCWGHYFVPTMVPYTECYRFVVVTFLSPDNDKEQSNFGVTWLCYNLKHLGDKSQCLELFKGHVPTTYFQIIITPPHLGGSHRVSYMVSMNIKGGQVGPGSQPITPQWDVCRQTTALGTMFLTLCALQCGGEGDKISATFNSFVPHDNFPNLTYFQSCIQSLLFC